MTDNNYLDNKYCYPNSNVLINKLNIKNYDELNETERRLSTARNFSINKEPIKGKFDTNHLQAIHKFLFQDLYAWAGKFRNVDIAKSDTLFCRADFIDSYLSDVFLKLEKQNYLINMRPDSFYKNLAFYFGEVNGVHPHREGNGRSQRVFFKLLSRVAGYEIDFQKVTAEQMVEASISSWKADNTQFEEIFKNIVTPLSKEQQLIFAKKILPPKHKALALISEPQSVLQKLSEAKKEADILNQKNTNTVIKGKNRHTR